MKFSEKSRDFDQFETSRKAKLDVEKSRSRKPSRLSQKFRLDETFATPRHNQTKSVYQDPF